MKKFLKITTLLLLLIFWPIFSVLGQGSADVLPEKEGIYDVPGRPDLKMRVFVHNQKNKSIESMSANCEDDNSSALTVSPTGWRLPASWEYKLNLKSVPSTIGSENFSPLASEAFSTWSNAVPDNRVVFKMVGETRTGRAKLDRQNIITWGKAPGNALAITYTWYSKINGFAIETDTIMNEKFVWTWTPYQSGVCGVENSYDAQNILTHELGHWMGLKDEYDASYIHHTMYGYGAKGEIKKDTLTQGEINSVSSIYH